MSLQTTQTQTPDTAAPAPPIPATTPAPATGGFSLDGFLGDMSTAATSATAVPGAPPEVLARVGTTIAGEGEFSYLVLADGTFRVTATPPTGLKAMDRLIRPDNEWAASWKRLCDQIVAAAPRAPAAAPVAPAPAAPAPADPAPTASAPAAPGVGTMILDGLAAVGDALLHPIDTAAGLLGAAGSLLSDLTGIGETPAAEEDPTAAPGTEAPTVSDPAAPERAPVAAPEGATSNLELAEQLAENTDVSHSDDGAVSGDVSGGARREAILNGDTEALKTIRCGEFTTMTIAAAGFDLRQDYTNPADGLPVGYLDPDGVTFISLYAVSNNIDVALAALLDVQNGNGTLYQHGSDEAKALKSSANNKMWDLPYSKETKDTRKVVWEATAPAARTTNFWVAGNTDITKTEFKEGQVFGAGLVAEQLGGELVPLTDRKPGDVQQRMDTVDAKTSGAGHSSTVYGVRGAGVAKLDGAGDPKLVDAKGAPIATDGIAAGWYRADGVTRLWEVGADTDPARVAELTASSIQLIDANRKSNDNASGVDRGADATQVGSFSKAATFTPVGASSSTSAGRLPTSRWSGWAAHDEPEVKPAP